MTALTQLRHWFKQQGRPNEAVSFTAMGMCAILDLYAGLHGQHLKDIQEENRKLKDRLFKLETKGEGE